MIVIFWVTLAVLLALGSALAVSIAKKKMKPRWGRVPTEALGSATLAIANSRVVAYLYESTDFTPARAMPLIVVVPSRGTRHPAAEHWAAHFALQGYATVLVDHARVKGTLADFTREIVACFQSIKEGAAKRENVDTGAIALFSLHEPSAAALEIAMNDRAVKVVAALSAPSLLQDGNRPSKDLECTVLLAHCKDNKRVPVEAFHENKDALGLGETDYLLLDHGGATFLGQEAVVAGFVSIRFKQVLEPTYPQITNKHATHGGTEGHE